MLSVNQLDLQPELSLLSSCDTQIWDMRKLPAPCQEVSAVHLSSPNIVHARSSADP